MLQEKAAIFRGLSIERNADPTFHFSYLLAFTNVIKILSIRIIKYIINKIYKYITQTINNY
jgi:hypothetical protein